MDGVAPNLTPAQLGPGTPGRPPIVPECRFSSRRYSTGWSRGSSSPALDAVRRGSAALHPGRPDFFRHPRPAVVRARPRAADQFDEGGRSSPGQRFPPRFARGANARSSLGYRPLARHSLRRDPAPRVPRRCRRPAASGGSVLGRAVEGESGCASLAFCVSARSPRRCGYRCGSPELPESIALITALTVIPAPIPEPPSGVRRRHRPSPARR
jgi:hypothetical protein